MTEIDELKSRCAALEHVVSALISDLESNDAGVGLRLGFMIDKKLGPGAASHANSNPNFQFQLERLKKILGTKYVMP